MRKIIPIIAILTLAPMLGGCNLAQTIREVWQGVQTGYLYLDRGLYAAATAINSGCAALEQKQAVSTPACATKISKLRAKLAKICAVDVALLTDDVAGNYVEQIEAAVRNTGAGGC